LADAALKSAPALLLLSSHPQHETRTPVESSAAALWRAVGEVARHGHGLPPAAVRTLQGSALSPSLFAPFLADFERGVVIARGEWGS